MTASPASATITANATRLSPAALLRVLGWLVLDTFRQSLAGRIFWLMLALTGISVLFCLSVGVEGTYKKEVHEQTSFVPSSDPQSEQDRMRAAGATKLGGVITLGFGTVSIPHQFRTREDAIHFFQVILGQWLAGTIGLLLALIWTAGFVPSFLEPSAVTVLLAKPVPRGVLLLGKYLGVLSFVALHGALFVFGTWWVMGLRTDVWNTGYLLTFPLLLLHFLVVFSFSILMAVLSRSTVVSVFGAIMFWLLCYGMNYARHAYVAWPAITRMGAADPVPPMTEEQRRIEENKRINEQELAKTPGGMMEGPRPTSPAPSPPPATTPAPAPPVPQPPRPALLGGIIEVGYWVLPKPADLVILLEDALGAEKHYPRAAEYIVVQQTGALSPLWSILSSLLSALAIFGLAAYQFNQLDY